MSLRFCVEGSGRIRNYHFLLAVVISWDPLDLFHGAIEFLQITILGLDKVICTTIKNYIKFAHSTLLGKLACTIQRQSCHDRRVIKCQIPITKRIPDKVYVSDMPVGMHSLEYREYNCYGY